MKKEKIKVVDFILIDAQGCTKQILQGLTKTNLKFVKEILVKVHVTPFEIYKGQTTRKEIIDFVGRGYFLEVNIKTYSREQEAWIRYHSDVWKRVRRAKIYSLE